MRPACTLAWNRNSLMPGTASAIARWWRSAISSSCARAKALGRNTISASAPASHAPCASAAACARTLPPRFTAFAS